MKKKFLIIVIPFITITGCHTKDANEGTCLDISFKTNLVNDTLNIQDSLHIDFISYCPYLTIFPGDSGHKYRIKTDVGIVVSNGKFRYKFKNIGRDTLVIINSLIGDGQSVKQDIKVIELILTK